MGGRGYWLVGYKESCSGRSISAGVGRIRIGVVAAAGCRGRRVRDIMLLVGPHEDLQRKIEERRVEPLP